MSADGVAADAAPAALASAFAAAPGLQEPRRLYLDLLKRALLGLTIEDASDLTVYVVGGKVAGIRAGRRPREMAARLEGRDWPTQALTMIGVDRLNNIERCVEDVIARGVPGDLLEAGVWRGGATIFMRGLLAVHGVADRRVWVADSFQGLPASAHPQDRELVLYRMPELAVARAQVQAHFQRFGLLDDQVRFLEGWFRDTLPGAPVETLAVLRLDGDLYESTWDVLVNLYPKLSVGGYVIVDDYGIPACRQAIGDYRAQHGITDAIRRIDWTGVYWQRSR